MKTKYRKAHPHHPHSRAERALTLAILAALLSGASAAPVMVKVSHPKSVTIAANETIEVSADEAASNNHKACLTYDAGASEGDAYKTPVTDENTLKIFGKVNFLGDAKVAAVYTGGHLTFLETICASKAAA